MQHRWRRAVQLALLQVETIVLPRMCVVCEGLISPGRSSLACDACWGRVPPLPRPRCDRCGHVPVELDWQQGEFFDGSGLYLICATHGALYAPDSGHCLGGRCNGKGLEAVPVAEDDGWIVLIEEGGQGVG